MALFPEMSTYYKGRTHTSLVVSEGNAPAEKYLPSAAEGVKFQYAFGPEGNQGVVIPKGKIVAAAGLEWDYETEHNVPAIKIAGATDDILGVNHHNVYERVRDRFSGNQPTIITREYIEVPLFSSKTEAAAINFGAAWVDATSNLDAAGKMFGKKIAVDEHGNYALAGAGYGVGTDVYENIIGTCLGVETDVPPAGYLQYFMEMDDARWAEFVKQMSFAPSPGRTKDADPFDVGTYPLGSSYLKNKQDFIKNFQAGIPFLTDGYFKSRTQKTYALDTADVVVNTSGHVTVANGLVTCTDPVGAALFIKLPKAHKLVNEVLQVDSDEFPEFANGPVPAGVAVKIGTVDVSAANVHVDYTNNMIVLYLTAPVAGLAVTAVATVLENQVPGIPTGWDFKGAYGAVRILLQK